MTFLTGLGLGVLTGAAIAWRFSPGNLAEDLAGVSRFVPAEVRAAGTKLEQELRGRWQQATRAYWSSREQTQTDLERELQVARSNHRGS